MIEQVDPDSVPIDFSRYPLGRDDKDAVGSIDALVENCRRELKAHQYCSLPGLIRVAALKAMVHEAHSLIEHANRTDSWRNCYLQREGDPDFAPDHPRNRLRHASYRMIAADLFHETSLLKRLYRWPPFQETIAAIVGRERLFPSADPLQPVNVICYGDGDQSAWHYDSTNAFTTTLMLQSAEQGGAFELAPNTRNSPNDEDIAYTTEVLDETSARAVTISREPGELTLFAGCNSLHRVSPVKGNRLRMMAVFVYENEPGIVGDPHVNLTVYGRTGQ